MTDLQKDLIKIAKEAKTVEGRAHALQLIAKLEFEALKRNYRGN